MRLWSLHPKYLDPKGLVALWRESLLAKKVLAGLTRGYRSHPQLLRFKATDDPLNQINSYLTVVLNESIRRGYRFNPGKIDQRRILLQIPVTIGQLDYELKHLQNKLSNRAPKYYNLIKDLKNADPHPIFIPRPGELEDWEIIDPEP